MNGPSIYAFQVVARNKDVIIRLLGFDSRTETVCLAIDERRDGIEPCRVTALFGSGTSASFDYDSRDVNKNNRPVLNWPKQYDSLQNVTVGPVPPPPRKTRVFRAEKACNEYKQLECQWKNTQQEWMYFRSPETKTIRGASDRKSKQLARDAQTRIGEIRQQMDWHQQSCEECKKLAVEEIFA